MFIQSMALGILSLLTNCEAAVLQTGNKSRKFWFKETFWLMPCFFLKYEPVNSCWDLATMDNKQLI